MKKDIHQRNKHYKQTMIDNQPTLSYAVLADNENNHMHSIAGYRRLSI